MSWGLSWVLTASVAGLLVCVWYVNLVVKRPRRVIQTAALTALAALVLGYAFPEQVEAKGSLHETLAIVFCYGAMLLGMAAQYGFDQARTRDFHFDPAAFFMPIFASPIVFIPLLGIVADLNASGALATPKLMVYLVAFQNGFFWRGFVEAHRQAPASSTLPSA